MVQIAKSLRSGPKPNIERSKKILSSLVSDKRLSRKFMDVWRILLDGYVFTTNMIRFSLPPDYVFFLRPGQFEKYRRKYILLYIDLLAETQDNELLDVLLFKLKKDQVREKFIILIWYLRTWLQFQGVC